MIILCSIKKSQASENVEGRAGTVKVGMSLWVGVICVLKHLQTFGEKHSRNGNYTLGATKMVHIFS